MPAYFYPNTRKFLLISQLILFSLLVMACISLTCGGCIRKSANEVVVYAALDREFSQPILNDLEQELGIRILAKYDQESNKTVGLVNELIQNQNRPRCDIFWNNEIMHTLRLQQLGLLDVYLSPMAKDFPDDFVSADHLWHGFAARARVLIINTKLIPDPKDYPQSIFDLVDPRWQGKCAMARPLFGTTATHAAVLYDSLGSEQAEQLMIQIAQNAGIEGGNKTVATKVASGVYAWGITDTDDAIIELENARPVAIVFPDQGGEGIGTLFIPNALGIIKNGPNPDNARQLVDRLLMPDVEERLARGPSAQIPLNPAVSFRSRVIPEDQTIKMMEANFQRAAEQWESVSQ